MCDKDKPGEINVSKMHGVLSEINWFDGTYQIIDSLGTKNIHCVHFNSKDRVVVEKLRILWAKEVVAYYENGEYINKHIGIEEYKIEGYTGCILQPQPNPTVAKMWKSG